ncbi:MAG: hypothetical protein KUG83_08910 [Gammaproteobacteria bacterium]|nr:hypothetical protein [Gammaproteobacteria bacterium]
MAVKQGCLSGVAVNDALSSSAMALTMTTLIFGVGFLVNNLADFLPLTKQGNALCAIFFLALILDLFVLPSLLIFFDGQQSITARYCGLAGWYNSLSEVEAEAGGGKRKNTAWTHAFA